MLNFSFILLMVPVISYASPDRLSLKQKDLSQVDKVYISPGLVSVIEFPRNIIEVRIGTPETLKVSISQVSPKEITVYFSTSSAVASNLIVRSDRKIYVFDVVPSKVNHQDYIKINGTFGTPQNSSPYKLIERINIVPETINKQILKKIKPIESVQVTL